MVATQSSYAAMHGIINGVIMLLINSILYNGLEFVSIRLLEKQLSFAGHCIRSKQPIIELFLRDRTKLVNCKYSKGAFYANYSRPLLKAIGRVEELVTSDEEVRKLMLDRETWRSRIKLIVAKNKEVDSSKREDSKIRRIKTRSAIVVIWYNSIEL
jgi:hypothetical protein